MTLCDGDQITCVAAVALISALLFIICHGLDSNRSFANELAFVVFCPPAAGAAMLNTLPLVQQQQPRAPEGIASGNVAVAAALQGNDASAANASAARTKLDLQALRQQFDLHHQTNTLQLQVLQQQHEIALAEVNQKMDVVAAQLQQQQVLLLAYEQQVQQQQQQLQQQQPVLIGGIGAHLNFDHAELVLIEALTPGMYANVVPPLRRLFIIFVLEVLLFIARLFMSNTLCMPAAVSRRIKPGDVLLKVTIVVLHQLQCH